MKLYLIDGEELVKLRRISDKLYSERRLSGDEMRNMAASIAGIVRTAHEMPFTTNHSSGTMSLNIDDDVPAGGLADNEDLLLQLMDMQAESTYEHRYDEIRGDVELTESVTDLAERYDAALWRALNDLVARHPPEGGAGAQDLWDADAPYLVLMTLQEQGVGVWDGRWDEFYEDTDDVVEFLKQRLGQFESGSGSGEFFETIDAALYDQFGEDEEEED